LSGFLATSGLFILLTVLLGLLIVLRGPGDAERVMAAQLLGTGGVAALLLLGSAADLNATTDLALVLAVLSAFVAVAFVIGAVRGRNRDLNETSLGSRDDRQRPTTNSTIRGDTPAAD
jgi:multicomponent Na+:H+ antiporter subunit F